MVLGTINAVMSPVVQGTHAILEGQTLDLQAYQQQKDDLEAEIAASSSTVKFGSETIRLNPEV